MYIQMKKSRSAATSSVALLGWICLIAISAGSSISGLSHLNPFALGSEIGQHIISCFQGISHVAMNFTDCVFALTDAIYNFLYYDYCDFILGLF